MAWSPPAHNAGIVWVSAPGDYATFNSNHTPDGTPTTSRTAPLTSLTFETEVPVDRDWSTPFGVYHYDARGATEECADLLGQQSGSRQYRKSGFAPPRNWASNSIRLLPLSRCSTAERLCPLLPARTERRDYSGREPANLGLWETPIRGAHVVPGWGARPRNPR